MSILAITFGCTKDNPTETPNDGGGNSPTSNSAPACSITTPQNGTTYTYDENINVSVFAEDSDGSIVEVSLYVDNVGYQNKTEFPYNFTIVSGIMSPGTHTINAIAKDNSGSNGESSVTITIQEPATESPDFVSFSDGKIPPTWQTATWFVDNTGGYDDIYSLRVNYQGSVMTTKTIQGKGYLEFYAKSNDGYYFNDVYTPSFKLYIDGNTQFYYTEETIGSWKKYFVDLEEGTHTFLWEYTGDYCEEFCTIDAIRFTHNSSNLIIGDYYQGGYVGFLDNTRQHGYIISQNDLGLYNLSDAENASYNYSIGQYSDWHLPNKFELETILNCFWMVQSTILPIAPIPAHSSDFYWSSSWDGYSNTNPYYICGCITSTGVEMYSWTPNIHCKVRSIRTF